MKKIQEAFRIPSLKIPSKVLITAAITTLHNHRIFSSFYSKFKIFYHLLTHSTAHYFLIDDVMSILRSSSHFHCLASARLHNFIKWLKIEARSVIL